MVDAGAVFDLTAAELFHSELDRLDCNGHADGVVLPFTGPHQGDREVIAFRSSRSALMGLKFMPVHHTRLNQKLLTNPRQPDMISTHPLSLLCMDAAPLSLDSSPPPLGATWAEQTRKGIFSARLAFEPALEQEFLLNQMAVYIPILRLSVSLIIVVYFAYFGLDELFFDRFTNDPAAKLILGFAAPAAVLGIMSTWLSNPTHVRRCIVLATMFNGAMLMAGYALELRQGTQTFTATALIIYLYYLYFMLGITHLAAAALATVSVVAHIASAAWGGMSTPTLYDHAFMMTAVIVIGGLSSRMMELANRRNWMSERQRRYLIERDALTGLYNLTTFFARGDELLQQARIERHPVTMMIASLEHLPSYHHELGHIGADACMRRLGAVFNEQVCAPHLAGRLGGEQFIVMLDDLDSPAAHQFAERLQTTVDALRIPHPGAPSGWAKLQIAFVSETSTGFASARSAAQRSYERQLTLKLEKGWARHE